MVDTEEPREPAGDPRLRSPSVARNREVVLEVFRSVLPPTAQVLEVGSGSGEHAVFLAEALPGVTWIPSDRDAQARDSIAAWTRSRQLRNVRDPVALDIERVPWEVPEAGPIDAVVSLNVIHITPSSTTTALLAGTAQVLAAGGRLVLYGPFRRDGRHTAQSNAEFDLWLKGRDPRFGVRDLTEVEDEAASHGLTLERVVEMPANNLTVVLTGRGESTSREARRS